MTFTTTPELLKTIAAVVATSSSAVTTATRSQSAPVTEFTGGAGGLTAAKGAALAGAVGFAALLV